MAPRRLTINVHHQSECGSSARFSVSQKKTLVHIFLDSFFLGAFVAKRHILQQKVPEGTNSNMAARNTLVQLLALYTNSGRHNAQHYRQTDGRTTWRCQ